MVLLLSLATFATVFYAGLNLCRLLSWQRMQIVNRLNQLHAAAAPLAPEEEELRRPFRERVLRPLLTGLSQVITRFTPQAMKNGAQQQLSMAGNPWSLGPSEWLTLRALSFILFTAIFLGAALWAGKWVLLFTLWGAAFGYLLPRLLLKNKITARQKAMERALPDVLDLLTVSVEAGLSFDGALLKVVEKMKGPLCDEFNRVIQETRMGKPRREALHDMARRSGLEDLSTFVGSLVQADQLGVSISNVLRLQSAATREKRRQRAEEAAMKAPVKMLIPLVFFIFPSIFVILLGPAIIQMLRIFSGMK